MVSAIVRVMRRLEKDAADGAPNRTYYKERHNMLTVPLVLHRF